MKGYHHSYRSDYPNQVHQLNLSISQNYHLLKNGEIKYQIKKFDVNWNNYEKTGKKHLANFLIRDHFSNCFYAEIFPVEEITNIKDFLFNAWKEKEKFEFKGIPKNLILGKHITQKFPELLTFSENIGLNIELAKNGFATGIRSVRDWEHSIKSFAFWYGYKNITDFQKHTEEICRKINLKDSRKTEPNLLKWANNNPRVILINNKLEFDNKFELIKVSE